MPKDNVFLDPNLRTDNINADKLVLQAREVAHAIMLPKGIEFARFEHNGRTYALEAQLSIQVSCLSHQVSSAVVRQGDLAKALEANKKRWAEEGGKNRRQPVLIRK